MEETFDKEESEESQGKVSMGTSLEVQTCSSVKTPFLGRKRVRTLHKNNTQVLRIKVNNQPIVIKVTKKSIFIHNIKVLYI